MIICIPKHISAQLKEGAIKDKWNIKQLAELNNEAKTNFFKKYVDSELAQFLSNGMDTAIASNQQAALKDYFKNILSVKEQTPIKKGLIDRINDISQTGPLSGEIAENFYTDLVAEKLGIKVTATETQKIVEISKEIKIELDKGVNKFGIPSAEYFAARTKMEKYLNALVPTGRVKIASSIIGRGSLLFSIKSPMVNIIGNTMQQLENRFEKRISSSQYTGKVSKKLMKDYVRLANDIYKQSGSDITRMNSYADSRRILGEEIIHSEGKGITRKISRFYEDVVFKSMLAAPDVYFSSITFADTANLASTKLAKQEELSGDALKARAEEIFLDATSIVPSTVQGEFVRETAIEDSLLATFQNDSVYSEFALTIRKALNIVAPNLRIGDQVMPFVKTPANVIGMTLDAGGLGLIKGTYQLPNAIKEMKAGNVKPMQNVAKNYARAGLGMTISFIISSAIDPDDFVGKYPTNLSEQELLKSRKGAENSIRINGKWISLDYLGFLGAPLVAFLYAKKYGKNLETSIFKYAQGLIYNAYKIPGLQAFRDIADMIANVRPEETEGVKEVLDKSITSGLDFLRSRTVPSFFYDIAKAMDTAEREVDWKKPLERLKSTLPFFRQTLKEKQDVFGAVIKSEPWWSVMLFGSRVQISRDSDLINEFSRLSDAGYLPTLTRPERSANSRMAQLKVQIGDEKFYEANTYFRNLYMKRVEKEIAKSSYKRKSDEDKQAAINSIRSDAMDRTLSKYHYKKPKPVKSEIPTEKKSVFSFKLVKTAYAAEGIENTANKLTWSSDIRSGWQKFLGNMAGAIPGEQKYESPIEGITADRLNSDQKREYYNTMLALREENPDWYYENVGNKVEKRILGYDLGKEEVVRQMITEKKEKEEQLKKDKSYYGLEQKKPDETVDKIIINNTEEKNINPSVVAAILWQESGYEYNARNDGGVNGVDRGIAQINSKWHPEVTDEQADDPEFAIKWLIEEFERNYKKFDGDINRAIAAHNVGPGGAGIKGPTVSGLGPKGQQYVDNVARNLTKEERKRLGIKTSYDN